MTFETGESELLDGTEGASFPFWSPDGRSLGFFADQKLKKLPGGGGPVQTLADAPAGRGGTWSRQGSIVFAADITGPLVRVSENGGTPERITSLPEGRWTHRNPHFLPDGEHVLFIERETRNEPVGRIAVVSVEGGEHRIVTDRGSNPQWADGFLFFLRDGNLVASAFDPADLELEGPLTPIADSVEYYNPRDIGNSSVSGAGSGAGVLIYRRSALRETQLVWLDREGRELESIGEPGLLDTVWSLRAGGSRVAVGRFGDGGLDRDIWIVDLDRRQMTRSTFVATSGTIQAALSYDGNRLAVSSFAGTGWAGSALWPQTSSGSGEKVTLLESSSFQITDWSSDGRYLLGSIQEEATGHDVAYIDLEAPVEVRTFVASQYEEGTPGRPEIFLSDFPAGTRKWQISQAGRFPTWSLDGRQLYYELSEGIYEVAVGEGDPPEIGVPSLIVPSDPLSGDIQGVYAVAGDRLLALKYAANPVPEPLRVIRSWKPLLAKH